MCEIILFFFNFSYFSFFLRFFFYFFRLIIIARSFRIHINIIFYLAYFFFFTTSSKLIPIHPQTTRWTWQQRSCSDESWKYSESRREKLRHEKRVPTDSNTFTVDEACENVNRESQPGRLSRDYTHYLHHFNTITIWRKFLLQHFIHQQVDKSSLFLDNSTWGFSYLKVTLGSLWKSLHMHRVHDCNIVFNYYTTAFIIASLLFPIHKLHLMYGDNN